MKKANDMNLYLRIGLIGMAIFFVINEFCPGLEFIKGVLLGLSLCLEFYGIYLHHHPDNPLHCWKQKLFRKVK